MNDKFYEGALGAIVKRAGVIGALNMAATAKTLADNTNNTILSVLSEDDEGRRSRKKAKRQKLTMSIDDELLASLTPEQRRDLFFAVRKIKV